MIELDKEQRQQASELDYERHEDEFGYWRRFDAPAPGGRTAVPDKRRP